MKCVAAALALLAEVLLSSVSSRILHGFCGKNFALWFQVERSATETSVLIQSIRQSFPHIGCAVVLVDSSSFSLNISPLSL